MTDVTSHFDALLESTGLSRAGLAAKLGVDRATVSRWGDDPPRYAVAYLELLRKVRVLAGEISELV